MKISLNLNGQDQATKQEKEERTLAADLGAAKKGDWNAKNNILRTFMPLLTSLAEKRSSNTAETNKFIEAGKEGLFVAVKKFKMDQGPREFQLFALDFIEARMDKKAGGGGFLSKIFGK